MVGWRAWVISLCQLLGLAVSHAQGGRCSSPEVGQLSAPSLGPDEEEVFWQIAVVMDISPLELITAIVIIQLQRLEKLAILGPTAAHVRTFPCSFVTRVQNPFFAIELHNGGDCDREAWP